MKTYQAPHEKLTEDQIKEIFTMIEKNHYMMKKCFEAYVETYEKYNLIIRKHFYPEQHKIMQVSVAELAKMMEYPEDDKS
jgi:hypothetical protein